MSAESKFCKRCNKTKSKSYFGKCITRKDKLQPWCKLCSSKYKRYYYKRRRRHIIRKVGEYAHNNRDKIKENYVNKKKMVFSHYGNICSCCHESNIKFLTIDHINNKVEDDRTSTGKRLGGYALYLKIINNKFPVKYQILCINCNWGKHQNKGVCPHKE